MGAGVGLDGLLILLFFFFSFYFVFILSFRLSIFEQVDNGLLVYRDEAFGLDLSVYFSISFSFFFFFFSSLVSCYVSVIPLDRYMQAIVHLISNHPLQQTYSQ